MNTGRSVQAPGAEPGSNLLVRLVLAVLAVLAAFPTTAAPATRIVSESLHDNSEVPPPDAAAWSPQLHEIELSNVKKCAEPHTDTTEHGT